MPIASNLVLQIAVVGAGPVGLALALLVAERLPSAHITLFDTRAADADLAADRRTLALSHGSVQLLERLGAWPAAEAQPIRRVHVSQAPPSWHEATVRIDSAEHGATPLGAVLSYGVLLARLQARWLERAVARPQQLHTRFGQPVAALKDVPGAVELDAGIAERFDLAVLAEGGLFEQQRSVDPRKGWRRGYGQVAWVGTVALDRPHDAVAYERFTRGGPLALLPLLPLPPLPPATAAGPASHRAALVWCTQSHDDVVAPLSEAQRVTLANGWLPAEAPRIVGMPALARFELGLNAQASLVQGRVVRIGNAAQTLHPVAGQGLNLGLRDAFALVEQLHLADNIDAALARVSWARGFDRLALIATTDLLARAFTWQAPGLAMLRGAALAALQATPPLKRVLARQLMFGWR